jgi:hypothetical protein
MTNGTRRRWGVSVTHWPLFTPGKTRYPFYRRLGGPQCQSGQLRKISPPLPGIPSPDRPARSRSLYRLSYPAHTPFLHANINRTILSNCYHEYPQDSCKLVLKTVRCVWNPKHLDDVSSKLSDIKFHFKKILASWLWTENTCTDRRNNFILIAAPHGYECAWKKKTYS